MKKITLKKLELTNYRNIEFATYEFDGNSKIIGENRIGKTNTLEAIHFLLTDKLLDGSSDIATIKPLKDTKLEVCVKATFDVDGKEVTLEKTFKEEWVKTRGTTDVTFKGHCETLIFNGVKQSTLKAYNQLVSEEFGFSQDLTTKVDFMRMLINPFYIGNLGESGDWSQLREFIITLVGDVTNEDVVKEKPELAIVTGDLDSVGGRMDQLKKKYTADASALKEQLVGDESQVKLLESTENPTDEEVAIAKAGVEKHEEQIAVLKSGSDSVDVVSNEIFNKLKDKENELLRVENESLKSGANPEKDKLQNELNQLRGKQSDMLNKKSEILQKMHSVDIDCQLEVKAAEEHKKTRLALIENIRAIDDSIKNPVVATSCPTCGRPFEESEVEKQRANAIANLQKQKDELVARGKALRPQIDKAEESIAKGDEILKSLKADLDLVEKDIASIGKLIESKQKDYEIASAKVQIQANPTLDALKAEIEKLKAEYRESREKFFAGNQDKQALILKEEEAKTPFKEVLAKRDYYLRQMAVLQSVKATQKNHEKELADVEQKKELLNEFMYTKLKLLDFNVSKVFGKIKFQLIQENIKAGSFDPICKPYIFDTVTGESTNTTWRSGSKSEQVATGIAIADCIKKTLDLPNMPFLFDEGGEISSETLAQRLKTDSQLICVKVVDNIQKPLVQKL